MRIVLTGAGGGLATAFLEAVPADHDVAAFSRAELDIAEHGAVMRSVGRVRPDLIVNLGAMTDVDGCETDPDRADRANTIGPENLALAARASGAVLLHVSTDYVFNGRKGAPYDELDSPDPLSVYGRSKLAGEERVRSLLGEHFIIRTGFVFGSGRDYFSGALMRLAAGDDVGALSDRFGTPTYVRHLAVRLLPLVRTGRFGLYHLAGPERTTWFEMLRRAALLGGFDGIIHEQFVSNLSLPATRPRDSSLTSVFLADTGVESMPALDEALRDILARP
jgi:dTDP-4-dehydrorhamnose reductase